MKRKKQIKELTVCLGVTAFILICISSAYAIAKIPEEKFAEKIYTSQLTSGASESFEEFFDNLETLQRSFFAKKIEWRRETEWSGIRPEAASTRNVEPLASTQLTIAISHFSPTSNLLALRKEFSTFMTDVSLLTKVKILIFGLEIPYEISFDEANIKAAFADSEIEQGQRDSYYIFNTASLTLGVIPEQIGIGINSKQIAQEVSAYFKNFDAPESATLPILTSTPEITQALLAKYKNSATTLAQKQIELKNEKGEKWLVKMAEHMDWVFPDSVGEVEAEKVEGENGATVYNSESTLFLLHPEPFASYIGNEISPNITVEASPVVITENTEGAITFEGSARNGQEINLEKLRGEIEKSLNQKNDSAENASASPFASGAIDIPVDTITPQITVSDSLKAKGITDLIGVGYSTLRGSPVNRIHNIKFGLSKFNGIIIAPQEEFSFTKVLGHVDAAHGWLPELVIKGDDTIPEYGGGLCQVSTTMYRAALYSGLPITARRNHSYAVSYYAFPYGYGLDATVYEPWPDMKFLNDSAGSILVQSYVEGTDVYYVFYGTNDGRYVKMEGPNAYAYAKIEEPIIEYTDELEPGIRKLKDHSHTGFKVDWYRSVYNADATPRIDRELIHSEYEARPEKYLEGTTEAKP